MLPVLPLPALQWTAATLSSCSPSQAATSLQKGRIWLNSGGAWSSKG